tara:strand:- start:431 stop:628 length:198 start_codon:yes stop_codon:yes gene_type:complete
MYLKDEIQNILRELNKINQQEVVKKQGDLYVAVNVLTGNSRILQGENNLIESLVSQKKETNLLKG